MKNIVKRATGLLLIVVMMITMLAACSAQPQANDNTEPEATQPTTEAASAATPKQEETTPVKTSQTTPKYVFLFIGDGMSYPQIQAAAYYQGAVESDGGVETSPLSFMNFPVAGSAQTFDATSFAPDSASTATSIATGHKTWSGTINMDLDKTTPFETIAEKLKVQTDYKVGIITSVNLNHATPAAFYAHQASRNSYYEIGEELVASGFDYFAGGELLAPTGTEDDQEHIHTVAENAGYKVVTTQAEAEALKPEDGKAIVIGETLADGNAISYNMDAVDGEWVLADYVDKGIEMLDNDEGFFMMVEGGKIDWAGHANDAAANINDTIALSNAVQVAVDFYNQHPDETLILVTGDHETGGLSIGYAGTDYDTYLTNLTNQQLSYAKYDTDYVAGYKENGTSFDDVMKDVKELFGLITSDDADASEDSTLVLTDYELEKLKAAYERTMKADASELTQEEYILYGNYEPLTVTITHLLNNKSGIAFTSYAHTGLPVPVFAIGVGEGEFEGYYDNTDIFTKMASLLQVQ